MFDKGVKKKHVAKKLEAFFLEVARLTTDHSVLHGSAVVYTSKLHLALEKVDSKWWKDIPPVPYQKVQDLP